MEDSGAAEDPKPREISMGKLAVVLAGFFVVGTPIAFFVWHTLSDFLAGRPVEGGAYLLALALAGVFVAVVWLLARFIEDVLSPR